MPKKGNSIVFILALIAVAGLVYFLIIKGVIPNPLAPKPQVRLNTQYSNPFDKKSQYVNPFDDYKNPFDVIGAQGHE